MNGSGNGVTIIRRLLLYIVPFNSNLKSNTFLFIPLSHSLALFGYHNNHQVAATATALSLRFTTTTAVLLSGHYNIFFVNITLLSVVYSSGGRRGHDTSIIPVDRT